jgi:hypothetical protein
MALVVTTGHGALMPVTHMLPANVLLLLGAD